LLERLNEIRDLRWIRLMYLFPDRRVEPVLEAVVSLPKVCKYVDMPFQHGAPEVLRGMNRPGGAQEYLRLLAKLRGACPDIAIRSTFIVGFPGETEAHFEQTMEFAREARMDWVGVFRYSKEDGSPAAAMRPQVPKRVSRERYDRLMTLQQEISAERQRRWVGRALEVLVESVDGARGVGRSPGQAPEVDGETHLDLTALPDTRPGDFVRAEVIGSGLYDLEARAVERLHRSPLRAPGLLQIGVMN
jgi:ribosomal protein S12 methylthiotransferase